MSRSDFPFAACRHSDKRLPDYQFPDYPIQNHQIFTRLSGSRYSLSPGFTLNAS